ncbi:MAG: PorT family protein [Prevotella sp.]|nr:PorT family protein [Prevotella sp.]
MKKFLVSMVAAMMMATPSFAQFNSGGFELDKANLYYGVRLGMTSANISGDGIDMNSKIGMTLGGVIGLRLSSSIPVFLESGLYYTERGAKKKPITISYNQFEIPVLIKYGIMASDDIAILPFIGPYFSYAISRDVKASESGVTLSYDEDSLNRANMGFKLGCGVEYNMLYAEVGYQLGVSNIADYDDYTWHSNALFINIGVNF